MKTVPNDMVLDKNLNPAWCNTPESCKRWLRYRLEQDSRLWEYKVRIGKSMRIVSVQAYLGESP